MKRYELTLLVKDDSKIVTFKKCEGDSLVELMSKLLLIVVRVQQDEFEKEQGKITDDDIPF